MAKSKKTSRSKSTDESVPVVDTTIRVGDRPVLADPAPPRTEPVAPVGVAVEDTGAACPVLGAALDGPVVRHRGVTMSRRAADGLRALLHSGLTSDELERAVRWLQEHEGA